MDIKQDLPHHRRVTFKSVEIRTLPDIKDNFAKDVGKVRGNKTRVSLKHSIQTKRSEESEDGGNKDDEELDPLHQELTRLKRGYRKMKLDYNKYREDSDKEINRQKEELSNLEFDRDEMKIELAHISRSELKKQDEAKVFQLSNLCKNLSIKENQTHEENIQIESLNKQIEEVQKCIHAFNVRLGGRETRLEKHVKINRQVTNFENRLQMVTTNFNTSLTRNADLRESIEVLRSQRQQLIGASRSLSKDLKTVKDLISQTMEDTTLYFEQRDDTHAKLIGVVGRSKKEIDIYNSELIELNRKLINGKKFKDFVEQKIESREDFRIKIKEEIKLKNKKGNAKRSILLKFKKIHTKLEHITLKSTMPEILIYYRLNQKKIYTMFNFVNDMNAEKERLKNDIDDVMGNIQALNKSTVRHHWDDHITVSEKLKRHLKLLQKNNNNNRECIRTRYVLFKRIASQLEKMYESLRCDCSLRNNLLDKQPGCALHNVLLYLQCIESAAICIMRIINYTKKKNNKKSDQAISVESMKFSEIFNESDSMSLKKSQKPKKRPVTPSIGVNLKYSEGRSSSDDEITMVHSNTFREKNYDSSLEKNFNLTYETFNSKYETPKDNAEVPPSVKMVPTFKVAKKKAKINPQIPRK